MVTPVIGGRMTAVFAALLFCLTQECVNTGYDGITGHGPPVLWIRLPVDGEEHLLGSSYLNDWVSAVVTTGGGLFQGRIRVFGNVSRLDIKKSYKLDLARGFDPGLSRHTYVLSAQARDRSFVRYRLAAHYFRKAGLECPEVRPVELFIDGSHRGIYLELEPLDSGFLIDRGRRISSLYKINSGARLDAGNRAAPEQLFDKKLPDGDMYYGDAARLVDMATRGISGSDLRRVREIIDLENALDYYAVSVLCGNWDGMVNNYYLYLDPEANRFRLIPWDLDQTFGDFSALLPEYENGFFEQLYAVPSCREYVLQKIGELFYYPEALMLVDSFHRETEKAVRRDPHFSAMGSDQDEAVGQVRAFLENLDRLLEEK